MSRFQSYHFRRLKEDDPLSYRLRIRTQEIINAIRVYPYLNRILDVGTADGLMLSAIKSEFGNKQCFGMDISYELLKLGSHSDMQLLQADAMAMPFKNGTFDIVIATALIEHLNKPDDFLGESYRLLRKGGLVILTSPSKFWINIAAALGIFCDREHKTFFDLKDLIKMIEAHGFETMAFNKFMALPLKLPFGNQIDNFVRNNRFNLFLLNQLIVGRQ
jgi:SAM-dependent methyltransferase